MSTWAHGGGPHINFDTNRFVDVRNNDDLVFRPLDLSFLFTYRVDAGTVFYIEYDDRYQQADQIERDTNGDGIDDRFFFTTDVKRTNRAVFTKLQYLFRY